MEARGGLVAVGRGDHAMSAPRAALYARVSTERAEPRNDADPIRPLIGAVPEVAFHRNRLHEAEPRVLDLFAGAGGFSLGFALAGLGPVAAVEQDLWASETLGHNHPGTAVLRADIRNLSDDDIVEIAGGADILIGGPPCQGYSVANNSAGDPKDPRNSLFREFIRAARVLQPHAVLMENVPGLLRRRTKDRTLVIDVIKAEFRAVGYEPHVEVLQAVEYGVPQLRPRLFILGLRERTPNPFPARTHRSEPENLDLFGPPTETVAACTVWDAISDLPGIDARKGSEEMEYSVPAANSLQRLLRADSDHLYNHKAMMHGKRLVKRFESLRWGDSGAQAPAELRARRRSGRGELSGKDYDQNNRRMHPNRPCHTIPASFYANFVHPYRHRNFTAREGARLQTFPDWYRFCGKPTVVSRKLLEREGRHEEKHLCQYAQIGNAVPPILAYKLARHLLANHLG